MEDEPRLKQAFAVAASSLCNLYAVGKQSQPVGLDGALCTLEEALASAAHGSAWRCVAEEGCKLKPAFAAAANSLTHLYRHGAAVQRRAAAAERQLAFCELYYMRASHGRLLAGHSLF